MNTKELITVDELCEFLQIGKNTAYNLINKKLITAYRIGHQWRISKESIHEYLNSIKTNIKNT
ncbi:MAG: helix-turn-helix domain-containing protein [Clostridiales bacterium]|nr:helix-turn-helix domain-containing protein [Clostridiales bacterium]